MLVLTATELSLVDPQTMATSRTVTLPATVTGQSRQLAVMNNGLVIIQGLGKAYSLRDDTFVTVAGLISNGGIAASRDGSRAIFGAPRVRRDLLLLPERLVAELLPADARLVHQAALGDREHRDPGVVFGVG